MNLKRFIGRNTRDAMQKVRLAYGDNAVVLSTKPCSEGIEVLAMAPETISAIERFQDRVPARAAATGRTAAAAKSAPGDYASHAASTPARAAAPAVQAPAAAPSRPAAAVAAAIPAATAPVETSVSNDVGTLAMSTLSFQDYVRERMLKKRQAELEQQQAAASVPVSPQALEQRLAQREQREPQFELPQAQQPIEPRGLDQLAARLAERPADRLAERAFERQPERAAAPRRADPFITSTGRSLLDDLADTCQRPGDLRDPGYGFESLQPGREIESAAEAELPQTAAAELPGVDLAAERSNVAAEVAQQSEMMMRELRAMKGLIEERFGALAFMDRLQKSPKQAQLISRLIECGFSPALIRKLAEGVADDVGDEMAWAGGILQQHLLTDEDEPGLEESGGVYAMIGSTGVGKTTTTAKLAAAFATRYGAANLGLITLDAYRIGAHEQLRAYGRILGVPVHTAHDRVALEDLLDLLSSKKMVLIDTAGLAQRDSRTRELLDMLSHKSIQRLLVLNTAQQGETIEDVLVAYQASQARGIVLSKMDEAVKLGPALDAVIRHRVKVVGVANGQRVPEDWHRLTSQALIQRAMHCGGGQAWRMDNDDVNLMFASVASRRSELRAPAARNIPAQPMAF